MTGELQSKLRSVDQKCESQEQDLRDAKRHIDNCNREIERFLEQLVLPEASTKQLEALRIELIRVNEQCQLLTSNLTQKETELERAHAQQQSLLNDMKVKLQDAEKSKYFLTHCITEKDQELAVLRRKLDVLDKQQLQHQSNDSEQQLQQQLKQHQERELLLIAQQEQEAANLCSKIEDLPHELSLLQINSNAAAASLQMRAEKNDFQRENLIRMQELVAGLEREKKERDLTLMQVNAQLDGKQMEIARLQSSSSQIL